MPIIYDIEHNMILVGKLCETDRVNGRLDKVKKIGRYIKDNSRSHLIGALALSASGIVIGSIAIGIHVKTDEDKEHPTSNLLIGLGTFISGIMQMGVKPLIREAIEKKEIKEIKDKGVDVELIIKDNTEVQKALIKRIKDIPETPLKDVVKTAITIGDELESSVKNKNEKFRNSIRSLKSTLEAEKAESEAKSQETINGLNSQVEKLQYSTKEDKRVIQNLAVEKNKLENIISDKNQTILKLEASSKIIGQTK